MLRDCSSHWVTTPCRCGLIVVLALSLASCGNVRLLATQTPVPPAATPRPSATTPLSSPRFEAPRCVEYDDYQGASMAFYSLSAIVQSGLNEAPTGAEGESLDAAVARFDRTVRLALAGEAAPADPDPIEELALFWVASDGCMR